MQLLCNVASAIERMNYAMFSVPSDGLCYSEGLFVTLKYLVLRSSILLVMAQWVRDPAAVVLCHADSEAPRINCCLVLLAD